MRKRAARTPIRFLAIGLAATALLSGCSDGTGVSVADEDKTATPSASAPASTAASASTEVSPAQDLGDPVATRRISSDGEELTLEIYPLSRNGTTSTLNFALSADPSNQSNVSLYGMMSDNNNDAGSATSDSSVDGVKLVDGANGKAYLVASDGAGNCLCSTDFFGNSLEAGDRMGLSATFAAPPEDVTNIDVFFPKFGTVTGVPVQ